MRSKKCNVTCGFKKREVVEVEVKPHDRGIFFDVTASLPLVVEFVPVFRSMSGIFRVM